MIFDFLISCILRFKSDDERVPVHHIVEETFPSLLNIFNKLVQIANPPLDVADFIKLICKIFWSSIYVRVYMSSFCLVSFSSRLYESLGLWESWIWSDSFSILYYSGQEERSLHYFPLHLFLVKEAYRVILSVVTDICYLRG